MRPGAERARRDAEVAEFVEDHFAELADHSDIKLAELVPDPEDSGVTVHGDRKRDELADDLKAVGWTGSVELELAEAGTGGDGSAFAAGATPGRRWWGVTTGNSEEAQDLRTLQAERQQYGYTIRRSPGYTVNSEHGPIVGRITGRRDEKGERVTPNVRFPGVLESPAEFTRLADVAGVTRAELAAAFPRRGGRLTVAQGDVRKKMLTPPAFAVIAGKTRTRRALAAWIGCSDEALYRHFSG